MTTPTILILGSGAREHALAYRFHTSDPRRRILVCPGNAGIQKDFECLSPPSNDVNGWVQVAQKIHPDLVMVGPEEPLVQGVVDALNQAGFLAFGPSKVCAQLEASKNFMKEVCEAAQIPTASSQTFDDINAVEAYFKNKTGSYVVKADGLCAGKGVTVCDDVPSALLIARQYLGEENNPLFGEASRKIVIESFLPGEEISVIGLCDGEDAALFAPVRDHKRLRDGNEGPNTGGMGVVGPLALHLQDKVKETIFLPALREMKRRGTPYKGFLYAGLMVQNDEIHLLEFNVRLGDPEAQALLFGTDVDLYPVCHYIAKGGLLKDGPAFSLAMQPTAVIVMASRGYPEAPQTGALITDTGLNTDDTYVFFAGVKSNTQGELITSGGRVLSCTAHASTLELALQRTYQRLAFISFDGAQFRKDIGQSKRPGQTKYFMLVQTAGL